MKLDRIVKLVCLACVLVCASAGVLAEEPPKGEPTKVDPVARIRHTYDPRGRDIFNYREVAAGGEDIPILLNPDDILVRPKDVVDNGDNGGDNGDNGGTAGTGQQDLKKELIKLTVASAGRKYLECEKLFAMRKFPEAAEGCDAALKSLEQVGADVPDLYEKLSRLQKAGEALQQRAQVEAEFKELEITIQSIVHREKSPAAVINGQVLKEGQFLPETSAQIYRIERGYVVFLFNGFKVRKRMR